jgi:hypothetical protein
MQTFYGFDHGFGYIRTITLKLLPQMYGSMLVLTFQKPDWEDGEGDKKDRSFLVTARSKACLVRRPHAPYSWNAR